MPWRRAATVTLDPEGRYLDADAGALDLLGVGSVEALRTMSPGSFRAAPPEPEDREAWLKAQSAVRAEGVLAELTIQRTDGELVRVRTAIIEQTDGSLRALFYPVERPTTDLTARIFRIADVLAEWRRAERRYVELDPESDEGREVQADVALLRRQHHALFLRTRARHEDEDRSRTSIT